MINRVIAPLLIKDGVLVQSKNYNWHLPIGNIEETAIQLQYFNIDEFLLISLDGMKNSCIDKEMLIRLRKVTSHPISYAGGVTSIKELEAAFDHGAERIVVNRLLNENLDQVKEFTDIVGVQGVVGSIDIKIDNNGQFLIESTDSSSALDIDYISSISSVVGEINLGIVDWEGSIKPYAYEKILSTIKDLVPKINCPITIYGGSFWFNPKELTSDSTRKVSIMVDNILTYKEDSVYEYKKKL